MEKVADGVWLLRGDLGKSMNIYFIEDGDGVVQFDAGTKAMIEGGAGRPAEELGGVKQDRARPRARRPPRHRPVDGRPGLLPPRRGRRRRKRRRDRLLHGNLRAAAALRARLAYPLLMRRWDGGAGEDRRHGRGGRRGRRLRGHPLPRPRPRADRPLARERPAWRWSATSIYLIDSVRLGKPLPAGRGERPPPRLGLGPRQGEGIGPQAGGARPGDRRRRPRRAAARREPARDAGTRGREVLSR